MGLQMGLQRGYGRQVDDPDVGWWRLLTMVVVAIDGGYGLALVGLVCGLCMTFWYREKGATNATTFRVEAAGRSLAAR